MIAIATPVLALVLGLTLRHRGAALVALLAAATFLFTFQSVGLILSWLAGTSTAFGPGPSGVPVRYDKSEYWAYGAVNLVLLGIGIGLLLLCHHLRFRRAARRAHVVEVG